MGRVIYGRDNFEYFKLTKRKIFFVLVRAYRRPLRDGLENKNQLPGIKPRKRTHTHSS